MALRPSETGHLSFTTLHTRDAKGAISRYADLFPQDVQKESLAAGAELAPIVSSAAARLERGEKRHLALEVLWNSHAIASSIRQGKIWRASTTIS